MEPQETTDGKPRCQLTDTNANIFALGARAGATLRKHGHDGQAQQMYRRICQSKSYAEALQVIAEYVDIS